MSQRRTGGIVGGIFSGFPLLEIRADDISGCWKRWFEEFSLVMEMKILDLGNETVNEQEVPVLRDRKKLLVLLHAIGGQGREAIRSQGFKENGADATYERALALLQRHFQREETVYVKTQKFVSVRQLAGEDNRDFLLRVERLGRQVCEPNTDNADAVAAVNNIRENLCLTLAVNGLRDASIRTGLMSKTNLTWTALYDILAACSRASDSVEILDGNGASSSYDYEPPLLRNIKQEVAVIDDYYSRRHDGGSRFPNTSGNLTNDRTCRNYLDSRGCNDNFSRRGYPLNSNRGYSPGRDRGFAPSGDRGYSPDKDSYYNRRYFSRSGGRGVTCDGCGEPGHIFRWCPKTKCFFLQ